MDVGEGRRRTSGAKGNGPLDVTSREECFVYSSTKWSAELRLAAEIQPEREKEALLGGAQEEMHLRWSPQPLLLPCWMATSERCNHCESLCCFSPVPFCFWRLRCLRCRSFRFLLPSCYATEIGTACRAPFCTQRAVHSVTAEPKQLNLYGSPVVLLSDGLLFATRKRGSRRERTRLDTKRKRPEHLSSRPTKDREYSKKVCEES